MPDKRQFVNVQEAAEIVGCSIGTMRRAIAAGEIPALKLSKQVYRIPVAALDADLIAARNKTQVEAEG